MRKNIQKGFVLSLWILLCVPIVFVSAKGNDNAVGMEHRNTATMFVQKLLETAEKQKGEIGTEIKAIADEQNKVKDEVSDKIERVQNRSKVKTFFFGTDYKNIGQLRSDMVKTNNQIEALKRVLEKATIESKASLEEQINALEKEQQKIEEFLKSNEDKFSMFGWLVKLFIK